MDFLQHFTLFLWNGLWQSLLFGSVVIVILTFFGNRLKPAHRFTIWALVLLQLSLPILPGSRYSLYAVVDLFFTEKSVTESSSESLPQPVVLEMPVSHTENSAFRETNLIEAEKDSVSEATIQRENLLPARFLFTPDMLFVLIFVAWLIGFAYYASVYFLQALHFSRMKKNWCKAEEPELLSLLRECRKLSRYRGNVRLLLVPHEIGGASCGFWRPLILLSERFAKELSRDELKLALLHELIHLKRRDPFVQQWGAILKMIYWFNPMLRFALIRLQRERELACDCAVLHSLEFKSRAEYGSLILRFAQRCETREHLPDLVGVSQKQDVKRRIEMILNTKRPKWSQFILGWTFLLALGLIGLTDSIPRAAESAQVKTELAFEEVQTITLRVKVLDHIGKPVPGATAGVVSPFEGNPKTESDAQGNIKLNWPKERDFFSLYVVKSGLGFINIDEKEKLSQNSGRAFEVKMPESKTVIVNVRNENNEPIENCDVTVAIVPDGDRGIVFAGDASIFLSATDSKGNAVFDWIPTSGVREVHFHVAHHLNERQRLEAEEGTPIYDCSKITYPVDRVPAVIDVALPRMSKVVGSVKRSDGVPIREENLITVATSKTVPEVSGEGTTIYTSVYHVMPSIDTDENGNFSFLAKTDAVANIGLVTKEGAVEDVYDSKTGNGEKFNRLDFVLQKGTRVHGVLRDPKGERPKRSSDLMFLSKINNGNENPLCKLVFTDRDSKYEFAVTPGSYALGLQGEEPTMFEVKERQESLEFNLVSKAAFGEEVISFPCPNALLEPDAADHGPTIGIRPVLKQ